MVTTLMADKNAMKAFIELGTKGLYPLFHKEWIEKAGEYKKIQLTGEDKINIRKISQLIVKHKNIDRQKTVLMALTEQDRSKFIIDFLQKVESLILEGRPELQ